MRAHRLFVQDDVVLLRSASTELKGLGFDEAFYSEAALLAQKVEDMLIAERRDQRGDGMPRFTWADVQLLERLATRLTEMDKIPAARHWRSLLSSVRQDLRDREKLASG